jgi:molybdopterin synthase catalytic subunit
MMNPVDILLTDRPLDLAALDGRLPDGAGAVSTFTGRVRATNSLTALELQHHPVMTQAALTSIGDTAARRFELSSLLIAHRFGQMAINDPIVHIAAAAPHRRAVLEAVSYTIDVLKTRAPFWKREWYGEVGKWIEPTEQDQQQAAQWLGETT